MLQYCLPPPPLSAKIFHAGVLCFSDISKTEDLLKEYMLYKQFLDSLTPQEWRDNRRKTKEDKKVTKGFYNSDRPHNKMQNVVPRVSFHLWASSLHPSKSATLEDKSSAL